MKYLTLLVFLGISLLCEAQQDSIVPFEKAYKRTYNIRKVSGVKPTIDGKLDEDFWTKQGEWSDRFVQIIPRSEERRVGKECCGSGGGGWGGARS